MQAEILRLIDVREREDGGPVEAVRVLIQLLLSLLKLIALFPMEVECVVKFYI